MNRRSCTALGFALLCLTLLSVSIHAQWIHRGGPHSASHETDGSQVEALFEQGAVQLTFLDPWVVRVRIQRRGPFSPLPSFAVVDAPWPGAKLTSDVTETGPRHSTSGIRIRTDAATGAFAFEDPEGRVFLEEDPRTSAFRADGQAARVWMKLPEDEHYFGFGEKSGPLDKRGHALVNWNTDAYFYGSGTDPLYQSIPFFLAVRQGRAFGLFLDAPERSSFDMGAAERDTFSFGAESRQLDYYVIYGPHPKDVLRRYTRLTGRMPLPPLWALGYQQCRYSYYPDARVREIAREFRKRRIPCDAIYLDIDYMDGFRCFTWDREKFPDMPGLIRDLRAQGFSVVVMIDPGIKAEKGYAIFDQGVAGDHFVKKPDGTNYVGRVWPGDCVFPDFHRPETRAWWGPLYRDLLGMGVRGVWNDMNEPSVFNGPGGTMPLDVVHRVHGKKRPHAYAHNTYGMQMIRATRDGIARLRPDERVFVLTRASYAGGQRYAAGWTGDNRSLWEHLEQSVPMTLNWGVAGQPFCGPDVGGFSGSPSAELLTRWLQVGALLPLYRNHTSKGTRDQEPWVHGTPFEAANRSAIELRYRLLPYLYSLFREAAETGLPVARLPLLEFPEWTESLPPYYVNQFLVGADLFVAPVVRIGETSWPVRLPPGAWFDFWTGQARDGDQRFRTDAPLDRLPLFARAGAVIPVQSVIQHTGQTPEGPLVLKVFPGPSAEKRVFPFYEDDGVSLAYRNGNYRLTGLSASKEGRTATFRVESVEGGLGPRPGPCRLEMHGMDRMPEAVEVNGRAVNGWRFDGSHGRVEVGLEGGLPAGLTVRVRAAR